MPVPTAAMPSRPESRAESATFIPSPSSPMRWSTGIRASSKSTWVVTSQASPIFFSGAPKVMPAVSAGTTNALSPRVGWSSVRAKRM